MATFLEGLTSSVQEGYCNILGTLGNELELFQHVTNPFGIPQVNLPRILYSRVCPNNPPTAPGSPPFTGGQCPVLYNCTGEARYNIPSLGGQVEPLSGQAYGKVRGFVGRVEGNNLRWFLVGGSSSDPNATVETPVLGLNNGVSNGYTITGTSTFSVTRVDGMADTCGDPDPIPPPYTPGGNTYNTNNTYNDNTGTSVTIPVAIVFGYATVNIDGTVSIPVNANFSLNPEFNSNFNFNINNGTLEPDPTNPSAPLPSPCADPGGYTPDPTVPDPPGSIPDFDPIPPATDSPTERRQLLKGCIVTTTALDGNETVIFQQDNPDLYVPSLGYVQFQIQVGNSSAWTNDIPVKCLRTFIPCPWDAGAVDVRGTPRFGNVFQVTPVYVTRTFNPTYPPDS